MIGIGLRRFAQKKGMKLAQNKVYGELMGYAVTLSEGMGYKRMDVTAKFENGAKIDRLLGMLHREGLIKKFQIRNLEVGENYISILFPGHAGILQKLEEFADWLLPILPQFGVLGSEYCARCGQILEDQGCWKLVDGRAIHVHSGCLTSLDEQAGTECVSTQKRSFVGALLLTAAVLLLAVVVNAEGYGIAFLGLSFSWAAKRGYEHFRGPDGPGKLACILGLPVLGVILYLPLVQFVSIWREHSRMGEHIDVLNLLIERFAILTGQEFWSFNWKSVLFCLGFALLGNLEVFWPLVKKRKALGRKTSE